MKKKIFLLFNCVFFIVHCAFSQAGEWTWVKGDAVPNQAGNFGTQGVSSPTNKPPAVYEGCEWTDHNGNFWLYGGQYSAGNFYADLWKYDPTINEWTWMQGPGTINQVGIYGTQGVSSPLNNPGGRGWAPSSWVDNNNNLWMFAGCDAGTGDMNALWMYDIATNEWTWMRGASFAGSPGSTGLIGVPNITNEPAARHECTASWIDGSGDLWFFGAFGAGQTDDLWRYNIATNTWTWMKGDPLISNPPVYGILGIPDPANTPGARNAYSRWADKNGNLWLFGGVYYASGSYNDVWKFNIASNEWTWMKGPSVTGDPGNYGVKCVEDSLNNPPIHCENRSCWSDSCGNFWMFGGVDATGSYDAKNDLWRYSPTTNNWTWINGPIGFNNPGNYGSIGVSAPTNLPPSRMGSFAWQDSNGNFWIGFGQRPNTNSYYNDLWRFVPDPACGGCSVIPVALFNAPHHICPGTCTNFTNLSQGATSYQWTFAGATPSTSTDANPVSICYNTPGNYTVSLIAINSVTSDTLTLNNYITVYPYPAPQGIAQNGDTLFANQGAVSYQWYHTGVLIPGATNYFYVATGSGDFNVVATDGNGCEVEAAIFDVVASVPIELSGAGIEVYPNPVNESLEIRNLNQGTVAGISIFNVLGENVFPAARSEIKNQKSERTLDVHELSSGMYYLQISTSEKVYRTKFIKQ